MELKKKIEDDVWSTGRVWCCIGTHKCHVLIDITGRSHFNDLSDMISLVTLTIGTISSLALSIFKRIGLSFN